MARHKTEAQCLIETLPISGVIMYQPNQARLQVQLMLQRYGPHVLEQPPPLRSLVTSCDVEGQVSCDMEGQVSGDMEGLVRCHVIWRVRCCDMEGLVSCGMEGLVRSGVK